MKFGALLLAAAPALASAFIAPALQQQSLRARSQGALRMVIENELKFDAELVRVLFSLRNPSIRLGPINRGAY